LGTAPDTAVNSLDQTGVGRGRSFNIPPTLGRYHSIPVRTGLLSSDLFTRLTYCQTFMVAGLRSARASSAGSQLPEPTRAPPLSHRRRRSSAANPPRGPRTAGEPLSLLDLTPGEWHSAWLGSRRKRVFDFGGALCLLVVLSPLIVVSALAILFETGTPILYRQNRAGRDAVPFSMLKFRTMRSGAEYAQPLLRIFNEAEFPLFKIAGRDPRVTRIGNVLRRSNFDEIPQLVNVLRGQMSLVGPRPFICEEAAALPDCAAFRARMLPGLTGPWQLRTDDRFRVASVLAEDEGYFRGASFRTDVGILTRTALGRPLKVPGMTRKTITSP
jgi:lipopolysaccharide/colanic/teichoic acid biosynthesis glycosyltransferase